MVPTSSSVMRFLLRSRAARRPGRRRRPACPRSPCSPLTNTLMWRRIRPRSSRIQPSSGGLVALERLQQLADGGAGDAVLAAAGEGLQRAAQADECHAADRLQNASSRLWRSSRRARRPVDVERRVRGLLHPALDLVGNHQRPDAHRLHHLLHQHVDLAREAWFSSSARPWRGDLLRAPGPRRGSRSPRPWRRRRASRSSGRRRAGCRCRRSRELIERLSTITLPDLSTSRIGMP